MRPALLVAMALAIGCVPAPRVPSAIAAIDEDELQRPAPGDPKRYELEAWGPDYLLEFRVPRSFYGPEQVLRIYPQQTVCRAFPRRNSLFSFADGSAVPDEAISLAPGVERDEVEEGKARYEVLGIERVYVGRGLSPLHMQIVGSASRDEATSPAEAHALSERRARAVAEYVRKARPDLGADQVKEVALGWDGFAAHGDPKGRVVFVPFELSGYDLPIVYTGPPLPSELQARIRELLARSGEDENGVPRSLPSVIVYAPSAPGYGGLVDDVRQRNAALFTPLFDAWKSGCRLPESEFANALEAFASATQPQPDVDVFFVPPGARPNRTPYPRNPRH